MEVFDDQFRERLAARYGGRPDWEWPDLAFVALSDERQRLRDWIDTEVVAIPDPGRAKLLSHLRGDKTFETALNELAVASLFRHAGVGLLYEPDLDGLTPDLFAPASGDRPAMIIEVWTREPLRESRGSRRAWAELVERISAIPVPVGLTVEGVGGAPAAPPTSGDAKSIASELRRWLLGSVRTDADAIVVGNLRFRVVMSVPGLRTRLAPPLPAAQVDSEVVLGAIRRKVRRYRDLARRAAANLVVVLASHPASPLTLDMLRSAVEGEQSFAFSFSPFASGLVGDWSGQLQQERRRPLFDPMLSAVGFVDAGRGDPSLALIRVPGADLPLPAPRSPHITVLG